MFERILIANRGEIACRIMQTAQSMGIDCVAVYSDADAGSKHVEMADMALCLGGAAPSESYLRGDAIITAALESGAEAIHPGYGFLSENPDFVEAVEAAGLTFIGPSASAIRAMGLKDAAKDLMVKAGVPVVPGYHGQEQDAGLLSTEADKIGYPVLIKAVAGGGGKGMRLVETAEAFATELASARSEAQSAFGNADVLIEKFVSNPRHIEMQIFGDGTQAVHLFERDCSLQRRHQKVIEEAPAPGMTSSVRDAMGQAAIRAAEAIAYKGAGTVEFIVDGTGELRSDGFYFMEMNTRLQVEHPVTEAVTGIDLVEWQIRVAAGAPLPAKQAEITLQGHAFEARLYAEDVPAGFLPATGELSHLAFGCGTRADSGVRSGDAITPYYDPMIAKLIVHGSTRDVSLAKMQQALKQCDVAGTVTNLAFLGALAADEDFGSGHFDTGLIARKIDALTHVPSPSPIHWIAAAMAAMGLETPVHQAGFTLWQPLRQNVSLIHKDDEVQLAVEVLSPSEQIWYVHDDMYRVARTDDSWSLDGVPIPLTHKQDNTVTVFDEYGLAFECVDPFVTAESDKESSNRITAPMPGLVRQLSAAAGQQVSKGDTLAVLEAMKMEHRLQASRDGIVAEVLVWEGDQIAAGAALIVLEEDDL